MNKPLSLLLFASLLLTRLTSSPLHADEAAILKVQVATLQREVETLRN